MTLRVDFTSQDFFRDPAAAVQKLRAAGPVIDPRLLAHDTDYGRHQALYGAAFGACPQSRRSGLDRRACHAMRRLEEILVGLKYDLCVLTGDYRAATFGSFENSGH